MSVSWEDIQFFERIERMLVEFKQRELAASLLKSLLHTYRDEENPDQSIELLKKILEYAPEDNAARRELVKFYDSKYGQHSQYQQFLKISKLNNFKYPVKHAIQNFEKNIIFDKGNYAYHRSWGVGNIVEIDSEYLVIDFKERPGHKMTIQMALQSLLPIKHDHLYVMQLEDPDGVASMLKDNVIEFIRLLMKSFGGEISVADIKKEMVPLYVEQKNWSKWWSRARTIIKKDPHFGFSEKKKDVIFMRDKPVTYTDKLLDSFTNADSFSGRTDVAIEFINNVETAEGQDVVPYLIDYSKQARKARLPGRCCRTSSSGVDEIYRSEKAETRSVRAKVIDFIKTATSCPHVDEDQLVRLQKDLVNLIEEAREDWPPYRFINSF